LRRCGAGSPARLRVIVSGCAGAGPAPLATGP